VAFALFITLYRLVNQKRPMESIIFIISFFFIMLSLRRSVMGLSAVSVIVILLILVSKGKVTQVLSFVSLSIVVGAFVFFGTNFSQELVHRIELRKLDQRELTEEKRFFEYEMLYKDTFVHYDYSPWTGYGMFDSPGNYGKGLFGVRSLHGDLTNIFHSSGFIGVFLYLAMFLTVFIQALLRIRSSTDLYIIGFCLLAFSVFTITGRYTQIDNMLMLTLVLALPLGKIQRSIPKPQNNQEEVSYNSLPRPN
ncbi:O-antigen ligase family protein, partial [Echinicola sediminis]